MGEVLLFGIIIAIPVTIIADLYLIKLHKIIPFSYTREGAISQHCSQKEFKELEMPGFVVYLLQQYCQ